MRKLSEPVLSRYRWTRRKPCGSISGQTDPSSPDTLDDELEHLIAGDSLYRWIVPDFEVLNLVPASRDSSNRHQTFANGLAQSAWKPVGNISLTETNIATIQYIGADRVPDYVLYDTATGNSSKAFVAGSEAAPSIRPDMYLMNSGKHRFRVVTNIAPPFVIESTKLDNQTCLTGELCLKVSQFNFRSWLVCCPFLSFCFVG